MQKRIFLIGIILTIFACLISACGTATSPTTSAGLATSSATTLNQSNLTTAATTAKQTTTGTTKTSSIFDKLDVLTSYNIIMTTEALAGSAKGIPQKYDANHLPLENAYHSKRYMAQNGKDFVLAEELIVIGENKWVKSYGKSWAVGSSSTAAGHITQLTLLYLALANGENVKIDETTVGGIPAIHYSYLYKTKSTQIKGEVWIANQSSLSKVIIKCFGDQAAIEENGTVIEDYRHVKYEFEVKNINAAISIKAPI